jgi:hypothetical protein
MIYALAHAPMTRRSLSWCAGSAAGVLTIGLNPPTRRATVKNADGTPRSA